MIIKQINMRGGNTFNILTRCSIILAIFILAGVFLFTKNTLAQILINEINWNGTETSSNDEWLELYNSSSTDINLDNYTLNWNDTSIDLTDLNISSTSWLLLERTDDATVPDRAADLIYTGSLRNSGEKITLKYYETIIDQVDFSTGWPVTNQITTTLERDCIDKNIWKISNQIGGTPKQLNTICEHNNSNSDGNNSEEINPTTDENDQDIANIFITGQACTNQNSWSCQLRSAEIFNNYISSTLDSHTDFSSSTKNNITILKTNYQNLDITILIFNLTKKVIGLASNWLFYGNF